MTDHFINMLHHVSHDLGALIIADEVIAYRLDYQGAQSRFRIDADLPECRVELRLPFEHFARLIVVSIQKNLLSFHPKGGPLWSLQECKGP